jgi:hypothetical protein
MLPRSPEELSARGATIRGSAVLRGLARRLRELLDPLLDDTPDIPAVKPRLTQAGGACPRDGTRLTFDPQSPRRHRCPRCGVQYEGEPHDHAWLWRYHLWLSERAIHLALLGGLEADDALQRKAADVIAGYARVYPTVPNRDNVLGPTRLFFSTYLESIWLVQLVTAAMLLRPEVLGGTRAALDHAVSESAQLIGSFDEGWSNRQVWNNAALAAAGLWLGEDRLVQRAVAGPHGLRAQLEQAVSPEGLWFEGENYHFFALPPTASWDRTCEACTCRRSTRCCPTSRCRRAATRRSGSAWCSAASRSCGRWGEPGLATGESGPGCERDRRAGAEPAAGAVFAGAARVEGAVLDAAGASPERLGVDAPIEAPGHARPRGAA